MTEPQPATNFIRVDADGTGHLIGRSCAACGATYLGFQTVCASCFSRNDLVERELALVGKLHTFTIVHRSFPGIETPFISAIVDLEGGGSLRGTVRGVRPEPDCLVAGALIKVVFERRPGIDPDGPEYLSYCFELMETQKNGSDGR